jgi:hypothetical protein
VGDARGSRPTRRPPAPIIDGAVTDKPAGALIEKHRSTSMTAQASSSSKPVIGESCIRLDSGMLGRAATTSQCAELAHIMVRVLAETLQAPPVAESPLPHGAGARRAATRCLRREERGSRLWWRAGARSAARGQTAAACVSGSNGVDLVPLYERAAEVLSASGAGSAWVGTPELARLKVIPGMSQRANRECRGETGL